MLRISQRAIHPAAVGVEEIPNTAFRYQDQSTYNNHAVVKSIFYSLFLSQYIIIIHIHPQVSTAIHIHYHPSVFFRAEKEESKHTHRR